MVYNENCNKVVYMSVCLECNTNGSYSWRGKIFNVEILHSRAGLAQQIWVENDNEAILIDCGDGCLRDILNCKLKLEKLSGIVITHGHFDHVGGLHSLLGFLRMISREQKLRIISPENCTEVSSILGSFLGVYNESMSFKIEHNKHQDHDEIIIGDMVISAREMIHCGSKKSGKILNQIPALGYRVSSGGEEIAITGDTGLNNGVRELVSDTDLAIIEATFRNSADVDDEIIKHVHLAEDIAHDLGKLARNYVLVHKGKR